MRNFLILGCVVGVIGYFGSKLYLHDKVSRKLDTLVVAAQPMVDVRYEGVSSTFSGELGIDGVTLRVAGFSDPIHVDSVRIVTPGYFHLLGLANAGSGGDGDFDFPDSLAVVLEGLSMPVAADYLETLAEARRAQFVEASADPAADCVGRHGFAPETLSELGYTRLVVDASTGYRLENEQLVVDLVTNVRDMYDMALTLTFDGVPTPRSVMLGAYQPRLVTGRIEYVDRSLEERVMKLCTEGRNLTEDVVIAARKEAFQTAGNANGIVFDEYVMDPYVEFLQGKDRFVITAQPTEPVNLLQIGMYKPSDVPALLNLSAEAL